MVETGKTRVLRLGFVAGGNNSVVECDLAKVEVAGSNPVSRSNFRPGIHGGSCLAEARRAKADVVAANDPYAPPNVALS